MVIPQAALKRLDGRVVDFRQCRKYISSLRGHTFPLRFISAHPSPRIVSKEVGTFWIFPKNISISLFKW